MSGKEAHDWGKKKGSFVTFSNHTCCLTDLTARRSLSNRLKVGMITLTKGVGEEVAAIKKKLNHRNVVNSFFLKSTHGVKMFSKVAKVVHFFGLLVDEIGLNCVINNAHLTG